MTKHGKKYVEAEKQIPAEPVSPLAAMKLLKEISVANFDETVTGDFRLGIDTRQADQQLRGTVRVRLSGPVGEGDSVELRPQGDPERFLVVKAPCDARAGDVIECFCPRPMGPGVPARVTKSVALELAATRAVSELEQEL